MNGRIKISLAGVISLALCLSLGCGDRADRTYRRGLRLARRERYDRAVAEMRRLVQIEPENPRARNLLGRIYRAQNLYTRAIEELTLAAETARTDPVPAYNLGGLYWDLDDLSAARRYYLESIGIDPGFSPALYRLGAAALRRGEAAEAEKYFRAFLETDPERPGPGRNNLGALLWRKGERDDAFREFEKALAEGDRRPEILYNFGTASLLLDREPRRGAQALLDYLEARPRAPERMDVKRLLEGSGLVSSAEAGVFSRDDYLRQGEAYEAAGQYRLAEEEYAQALRLDPASAEAHHRLGVLYDRFLGDPEKAAAHYEAFLERRPRSPAAGQVIARLRELRPPLPSEPVWTPAALDRAVRPATTPPEAGPEDYRRRGGELTRAGDYAGAASAYRRSLDLEPDIPSALIGLGRALHAAGDYPGAAEALLRARRVDSAAPVGEELGRVYVILGAAALADGRFEEAAGHYERAREEGLEAEADEGLWKVYHNHFRSLEQRGEYAPAAERLERALRLRPEVEDDYLELAALYGERLNNPGRAREYYRRYLELFPRGRQAEAVRTRLRPPAPARTPVPPPPPAPTPPPVLSAVEHYNRGAVYQREGRDDRAREEYERAIGLRPDFYQAHYNLGIVHHRGGRTDRALAAFKEAARINPNFPQAQLSLFNLYWYHYRMKNLARPHALRYIELAPGTPQARQLRIELGLQ